MRGLEQADAGGKPSVECTSCSKIKRNMKTRINFGILWVVSCGRAPPQHTPTNLSMSYTGSISHRTHPLEISASASSSSYAQPLHLLWWCFPICCCLCPQTGSQRCQWTSGTDDLPNRDDNKSAPLGATWSSDIRAVLRSISGPVGVTRSSSIITGGCRSPEKGRVWGPQMSSAYLVTISEAVNSKMGLFL